MHRVACAYSMYFNKKHDRVGHVFQGRFKAKEVKDDNYLLYLSRYIHRNPADIVDSKDFIENYQWSSYGEYLEKTTHKICDCKIIFQALHQAGYGVDYQKYVNTPISGEEFTDLKDYLIQLD
jgi:putative transposase